MQSERVSRENVMQYTEICSCTFVLLHVILFCHVNFYDLGRYIIKTIVVKPLSHLTSLCFSDLQKKS